MGSAHSSPLTAPSDTLAQRQFSLPTGLLGYFAGWIMARENRRMNRMALDWLQVEPEDDVLEVGFGPGQALKLISERTAARRIVGVDPSPLMIQQASKLNTQACDAGRMSLLLGSVAALPYADGSFSRVVAISNFHIWPDRAAGLREIHRILRPDGRLVICVRRALERPWPWSSPGVSAQQLRRDVQMLADCGFDPVVVATRKLRRRLICLVASKPNP